MKTVLLYVCAIFLLSCQKEVLLPHEVKEEPKEVIVPEPQPETEPEPEPEPIEEPDPAPGEISESVFLRNLPLVFNSQNHYKLVKIYTSESNLWEQTPSWAKDDVHTFNDMGDGVIESTDACPSNPFTSIAQNWTAFVDEEGVRLTWVDAEYNATTYVLVKATHGVSFKAYHTVNGVKIYSEFKVVSAIK